MSGMLRRRYLVAPLLLLAFGCAGSSSSHVLDPNFTFPADLTSQDSSLKTFNGGAGVAGWNHLTGATTIDGGSATVDMQASVAYTGGSGPFFGFVTLTKANGDTLNIRMDGESVKNATTGETKFDANLTVLGGTGGYTNATGSGSFDGSRSGVLGSPVSLSFKLNVRVPAAD